MLAGARLQCGPDGRIYLTGVYLPVWQGINLLRQWDNPNREPDDWSEEDLADSNVGALGAVGVGRLLGTFIP